MTGMAAPWMSGDVPRTHAEEAGDTYMHTHIVKDLNILSPTIPYVNEYVCVNPGEDLIEVSVTFLDRPYYKQATDPVVRRAL